MQQIGVTRSRPKAGGHVHFSIAALMDNRQGITDQLKAGLYAGPALVPATPWLGSAVPAAPTASIKRGAGILSIKIAPGADATHYAIWSRHGNDWRFAVAPAARPELTVAGDASAVVVSAIDRLGNESERVSVLKAPGA